MRYVLLLLTLLFTACGIDVLEMTTLPEAKTFAPETKTNDPLYEKFYQEVEEYTARAIEALKDCDIPDPTELDTTTIELAVYTVGFSTVGGALFEPNDFIGLRDDLTRPMSFYGHELGRWVMYKQGNPLWEADSDGENSGWTVEPMRCVWNTCETISLCYVDEAELGFQPTWCDVQ